MTNSMSTPDPAAAGLIVAQPDALINICEVRRLTSLSKVSLYRLIQRGRFPASIELIPGGRRVAWRVSEVSAWCRSPLDWGDQVTF